MLWSSETTVLLSAALFLLGLALFHLLEPFRAKLWMKKQWKKAGFEIENGTFMVPPPDPEVKELVKI